MALVAQNLPAVHLPVSYNFPNAASSTTLLIPSWANFIDIIMVGAGGGGDTGTNSAVTHGTVVNYGYGGNGGSWTAVTLGAGSFSTNVLATITVGPGGIAGQFGVGSGGDGGASSVSATGMTMVTAAGGAGAPPGSTTTSWNVNNYGGSPGDETYLGVLYPGGVQQTTQANPGADGNAPGGGAAGQHAADGSGGTGADGEIWLIFRQF
jgi:hypothetical protein